MKHIPVHVLGICLILLIRGNPSLARTDSLPEPPVFDIEDPFKPINLTRPAWMLVEGDSQLSIEALRNGNWGDAQWVEVGESSYIQPGSAQWIHLRIRSEAALENWLLYVEDETKERGFLYGFDDLEVYLFQKGEQPKLKRTGRQLPRSLRDHKPDHVFNLVPLSVQENEILEIWIKFQHQRIPKLFPALSLRHPILSYPTFPASTMWMFMFIGGLWGALGIIGITLFAFTKEASYGWYALFTLTLFLVSLCLLSNDPIQRWLSPEIPSISSLVALVLGTFTMIGFFEFCMSIAPPSPLWRKINVAIYTIGGIVNILGGVLLDGFGSWPPLQFVTAAMVLAVMLNCLVGSVWFTTLLRKKSFLDRAIAATGILYFGTYILVNLIYSLGWIDVKGPINLSILIPIGPALLATVVVIYRFRQAEASKAEAKRLAELDTAKTRLYTNITHEFRTPLTVIQGMTDKMAERPERFLSSGLHMIKRNSKQLLRLVNQMLDLSKLESGNMELHTQPTEIAPFLAYVVESFQSYAETQGLSLNYYSALEDLNLEIDPDRLTDILSNLLSNAIKFTPEGGQITVDSLRKGNQLYLHIRDTGVGIAPEEVPHVFDRFYQADDSATRQAEGTGIGLALTRELVRLMQGEISLSSELGKGSTFTIRLPIIETASEPVFVETTESSAPASPIHTLSSDVFTAEDAPRILLVEDNADVAAYIRSCLEGDYRFSWAQNGKQGIEKAFTHVPDIVISDIMMPEKDGFEVCYVLKHDLRTSHIPVILLTARADVDSKLMGLRKGADAYLSKPFDETELRTRIENLLAVRRTLQGGYTQAEGEMAAETPEGFEQEDEFIGQFREVVMAHLGDPKLDVSRMSVAMNLSRTPLHNKIKALTGMSTTEFMRHIRLHEAREMLSNPELNVSEIAYATGFQSHAYFSRRFREVFGMTPKEWRGQQI